VAKILRYDNTLVDIEADAPSQGGFLVLTTSGKIGRAPRSMDAGADSPRKSDVSRGARPARTHRVRFRFEPVKGLASFWPLSEMGKLK